MRTKSISSKKIFVGFFIALLLVTGVVGALSGIPHTHGSDYNHKNHQSCALFQLSSFHSDTSSGSFPYFSLLLFAGFIFLFDFFAASEKPQLLFFLRAPPVTL